MKKISKFNLIFLYNFIVLIFAIKALAIDLNIPKTDEEWTKAMDSLNWKKGPSLVKFNEANSTIDIPSNFDVVEQEDAHQILYWLNGVSFDYVNVYAINNKNAQYMFFFVIYIYIYIY